MSTEYKSVTELLEGHDVRLLQAKADWLKTTDAEGWVAGELLEMALERFKE